MPASKSLYCGLLQASGTTHLSKNLATTTVSSTDDGYSSVVRSDSDFLDFTYFSFNCSSSVNEYIFNKNLGTVVVQKITLHFYVQNADEIPIKFVEFLYLGTPSSSSEAHDSIESSLSTYTLKEIKNESKTKLSVEIASSPNDSACESLSECINIGTITSGVFRIAMRRKSGQSGYGYMDVGGLTMLSGEDQNWESADAGEISDPPTIEVEYDVIDTTIYPLQEFRYTTVDPTSIQSTPSNSLGGYASSNAIYDFANVGRIFSKSDDIIYLSDGSLLPNNASGIIQIGPEIIKYTETASGKLLNLQRNVVPEDSYPASLSPSLERISYLDVDSLFDNNPNSKQVQYRCIAVINVSNSTIDNVKLFLRQGKKTTTVVDVAIEVPSFDTTSGTFSSATASSDTVFYSTDSNVLNLQDNFFKGAHVVIDPDGLAQHVFVTKYTMVEGQAEFTLDRAAGVFLSGTVFRINPAPCQTVVSDTERPINNINFFGFLNENGSNSLGHDNVRSRGGQMIQHDVFYLWIKRTFISNSKSSDDTGAVIILEYT